MPPADAHRVLAAGGGVGGLEPLPLLRELTSDRLARPASARAQAWTPEAHRDVSGGPRADLEEGRSERVALLSPPEERR